jgi:hypothetical protein
VNTENNSFDNPSEEIVDEIAMEEEEPFGYAPPPSPETAGSIFAPFTTYSSAKLNTLTAELKFTQTQLNGILSLKKDPLFDLKDVEFSSARKMNEILDTGDSILVPLHHFSFLLFSFLSLEFPYSFPISQKFKKKRIVVEGRTYTLYFRHAWQVLKQMLLNPELVPLSHTYFFP